MWPFWIPMRLLTQHGSMNYCMSYIGLGWAAKYGVCRRMPTKTLHVRPWENGPSQRCTPRRAHVNALLMHIRKVGFNVQLMAISSDGSRNYPSWSKSTILCWDYTKLCCNECNLVGIMERLLPKRVLLAMSTIIWDPISRWKWQYLHIFLMQLDIERVWYLSPAQYEAMEGIRHVQRLVKVNWSCYKNITFLFIYTPFSYKEILI